MVKTAAPPLLTSALLLQLCQTAAISIPVFFFLSRISFKFCRPGQEDIYSCPGNLCDWNKLEASSVGDLHEMSLWHFFDPRHILKRGKKNSFIVTDGLTEVGVRRESLQSTDSLRLCHTLSALLLCVCPYTGCVWGAYCVAMHILYTYFGTKPSLNTWFQFSAA